MTIYHACSAETSRKSGAVTYPEPLGPPRPVAGDLYFTLYVARTTRTNTGKFPVSSAVPVFRKHCVVTRLHLQSVKQALSAFRMVRARLAKLCLRAGNMKFRHVFKFICIFADNAV